ncbi:MAG: ferritin-like domain-containing protein [Marinobacter sp.]
MITALANTNKRPAKEPGQFHDDLVSTLAARRHAVSAPARGIADTQPLARGELVEWLRFQCWYRHEAGVFIRSWLSDDLDSDILAGLCRQVADEHRHYRLLLSHLNALGETMTDWAPEPEWVNWISEFHASGDDSLERIATCKIAGEPGATDGLNERVPRVPAPTRLVLERILADAGHHVDLGRRVVEHYATSLDRQALVHARVMRAFELEQKAQLAFNRRIRAMKVEAANDT